MRYGYHLARYQAKITREAYHRRLPSIVGRPIRSPAKLPVHVVAFSSAHDLPEQVASIRSLLRHAGTPRSITVVSDGTHDARQRALLEQLHPTLRVTRYDEFARADLPDAVLRYAELNPMGKKLMVMTSLRPVPTLYVDSDVLFFRGARAPEFRLALATSQSRYLAQDWAVGYDRRLLPEEDGEAVNAGLLFVASPLDWAPVLARIPEPVSSTDVYLEQTLVHLAMQAAGATPLPVDRYLIHRRDQFTYRDAGGAPSTVLRHYVSITRHKFWLAVSRSSLLAGRLSQP